MFDERRSWFPRAEIYVKSKSESHLQLLTLILNLLQVIVFESYVSHTYNLLSIDAYCT